MAGSNNTNSSQQLICAIAGLLRGVTAYDDKARTVGRRAQRRYAITQANIQLARNNIRGECHVVEPGDILNDPRWYR
jgi:hypothetical protein